MPSNVPLVLWPGQVIGLWSDQGCFPWTNTLGSRWRGLPNSQWIYWCFATLGEWFFGPFLLKVLTPTFKLQRNKAKDKYQARWKTREHQFWWFQISCFSFHIPISTIVGTCRPRLMRSTLSWRPGSEFPNPNMFSQTLIDRLRHLPNFESMVFIHFSGSLLICNWHLDPSKYKIVFDFKIIY